MLTNCVSCGPLIVRHITISTTTVSYSCRHMIDETKSEICHTKERNLHFVRWWALGGLLSSNNNNIYNNNNNNINNNSNNNKDNNNNDNNYYKNNYYNNNSNCVSFIMWCQRVARSLVYWIRGTQKLWKKEERNWKKDRKKTLNKKERRRGWKNKNKIETEGERGKKA